MEWIRISLRNSSRFSTRFGLPFMRRALFCLLVSVGLWVSSSLASETNAVPRSVSPELAQAVTNLALKAAGGDSTRAVDYAELIYNVLFDVYDPSLQALYTIPLDSNWNPVGDLLTFAAFSSRVPSKTYSYLRNIHAFLSGRPDAVFSSGSPSLFGLLEGQTNLLHSSLFDSSNGDSAADLLRMIFRKNVDLSNVTNALYSYDHSLADYVGSMSGDLYVLRQFFDQQGQPSTFGGKFNDFLSGSSSWSDFFDHVDAASVAASTVFVDQQFGGAMDGNPNGFGLRFRTASDVESFSSGALSDLEYIIRSAFDDVYGSGGLNVPTNGIAGMADDLTSMLGDLDAIRLSVDSIDENTASNSFWSERIFKDALNYENTGRSVQTDFRFLQQQLGVENPTRENSIFGVLSGLRSTSADDSATNFYLTSLAVSNSFMEASASNQTVSTVSMMETLSASNFTDFAETGSSYGDPYAPFVSAIRSYASDIDSKLPQFNEHASEVITIFEANSGLPMDAAGTIRVNVREELGYWTNTLGNVMSWFWDVVNAVLTLLLVVRSFHELSEAV